MNDKSTGTTAHWSFWVIGVLALIWNVLGCANYIVQLNPGIVASMPDTHQAIISNRPAWATGGFAIAVFAGALGCLLLLFRKSFSIYLFALSLLGVVVTMIHTAVVAGFKTNFSAFELSMMLIMPLVVGVFLLWYAKYSRRKKWLR